MTGTNVEEVHGHSLVRADAHQGYRCLHCDRRAFWREDYAEFDCQPPRGGQR